MSPTPPGSPPDSPRDEELVKDVFGSDIDSQDEGVSKPFSRARAAPVVFSDDELDDEDAVRPGKLRKRALDSSDEEDEGTERRGKRGKDAGRLVRKGAESDDEHDDFIDDDGVDDRARDNDEDVIRTKGGWHVSDDIEDDGVGDDEPVRKKPRNAIEQAVEDNKAMRRPRKKEADPAKVDAECVTFLERMMRARDEDIKAYKAGRPALEKLKMIRDVELMVMKVSHREALIDHMLLAIIKAWLDPMEDGALPNLQVRSSLLNILDGLKVDSDWVEKLENSQGLGRVVHFLSLNDDHPPNKRIAKKLMEKWARPVYRSDADFHDLLDEFDKPEEGHRAPKDGIASRRRAARETVKHFRTTREKIDSFKTRPAGTDQPEQVMAQIPRPAPFLFTALADASVDVNEKQVRERRTAKATTKKVNRTMANMRRLNKMRSARAAKPSVNGRR